MLSFHKHKRVACYLLFSVLLSTGVRATQIAMKTCMVHIMKQFKLETCETTMIPFQFHKASMFLKANGPVILKFTKIK